MTDQTFFWRVSVQTEAVFNSLTRPIIENLIPPRTVDERISRRNFLRGVGASAVAGAVAKAAAAAQSVESLDDQKAVGPEPIKLVLQVNGKRHEVEVEPRVTLLDALRNRLQLTGTKVLHLEFLQINQTPANREKWKPERSTLRFEPWIKQWKDSFKRKCSCTTASRHMETLFRLLQRESLAGPPPRGFLV